jgi:hypothetical protein
MQPERINPLEGYTMLGTGAAYVGEPGKNRQAKGRGILPEK